MKYTEQDEILDNLKDIEIFKKSSRGFDTISFKNLTIEYIQNRKGEVFYIEPDEFFKQGLCFDGYSQSVVLTIYNALSDKNKEKVRVVILKDHYKFANFLDKMWGRWFK